MGFEPGKSENAQPHETVDLAVYEGWDFDRINSEARRLRRLGRENGIDAVVSDRRKRAAAIGRKPKS
ncbi:MAG: hypothetical protein ACYCUM_11655 [Solirubrobacteraceae bacterium]